VPALMKRVSDDIWGKVAPDLPIFNDDTPYEDVAKGAHQGSKYAALEALRKLAAPEKVAEALLGASKTGNKGVKAWALKNFTEQNEKK
jgi:hypothetical protein